MRILYTLGIHCYALAIRLVSPFHTKARQMVRGWRQSRCLLRECAADPRPTLWFHAPSLGEFEQARPLLERLRAEHTDYRICVTFFSPSGYEVRHNYPLADLILYLPPDTWLNARLLVRSLHPEAVFFVKYDYWFNCLDALRRQNVKVYIISAIFRPGQYFFQWYGTWFLRQINRCFTHIFVQNEESLQLLRSHGIDHCSRTGDTRFDRVKAIADQARTDAVVERFVALHRDCPVVLAGSSWPPDEQLLLRYCKEHPDKPLSLILAPHVISESHLTEIERIFGSERCVRYSRMNQSSDETTQQRQVLIIDNIGILATLYRYAYIAYIGGGWGQGIHNILEALTFGVPVLFGPNHQKFQEAKDILACGGGFAHRNYDELRQQLDLLLDDSNRRASAAEACSNYVNNNIGSVQMILDTLQQQSAQN